MKPLKGLKRICAVIVGSVFFVAGTLKLIDPVGAGLVVTEYFKFFHTAFLNVIAQPLGVAMALLECLVGAALVTGVAKRLAGFLAAVMTLFFTILTAILAIYNPHMDCGCFGEAIHLSHMQTFLKNVVLCLIISVMLSPKRKDDTVKAASKVAFAIASIATVFLTVYSLLSVPFIDFTPFGIGAELAAVSGDSEESYDQYEAVFIYEKEGREDTFTLENLPDSTWTFVRTETSLVEPAEKSDDTPDLSFTDALGEYRNEDIIDGDVIVVSSYKPEKLSLSGYERIASLLSRASDEGFKTAFIVASDPSGMEQILESEGVDPQTAMTVMSNVYFADYKTLITVNRSNGGSTWLRDGVVMSKNAALKLPSRQELSGMYNSAPVERMLHARNVGRLTLQSYLLFCFAVMILL